MKTRTVLLVDDDSAVRRICCLILEKYGYTVYEAENADMAAQIWDEHAKEIDLLVTDVMMPGKLDGLGLAWHCHDLNPDLKIVVISGYCSNFISNSFPAWISFLPKPFTPETLNKRLQDCLEAQD